MAELPTGSFLVLRAADVQKKGSASNVEDGGLLSIVLLHGWLQSSEAWLGLAQKLRERRADILLIDFYAHGHSPTLGKIQMHSVAALAGQVARVIGHVGWHDRRLVLGGMSMGASVALRYAAQHRHLVDGLLLVAPSGMPEPVMSIPRFGQAAANVLLGQGDLEPVGLQTVQTATLVEAQPEPFERKDSGEMKELRLPGLGVRLAAQRWLARLNFIKRTPQYDVGADDFAAAREFQWPVSLVLGKYDVVHAPHVPEWRREIPQARILMAAATHWWLCMGVDALNLEDDVLWNRARIHAAEQTGSASARGPSKSRL